MATKSKILNIPYNTNDKLNLFFANQITKADLENFSKIQIVDIFKSLNDAKANLYPIVKSYIESMVNNALLVENLSFVFIPGFHLLNTYEMSSINNKELGFNGKFFIRMNYNTPNILDIIKLYINLPIDISLIIEKLSNATNYSKSIIEQLLIENIFKMDSEDDNIRTIIDNILVKISAILLELYDTHILFISNKSPQRVSISEYNIFREGNSKRMGIVFTIPEPEKDFISFNPVYCVNKNDPTKNEFLITDSNLINYIYSKVDIKVERQQPIISDRITEIIYDPNDRGIELPVVKVNINGRDKTFLLGRSGNLYEDDNRLNNLVGKIIFTDNDMNHGKIYWCKEYNI